MSAEDPEANGLAEAFMKIIKKVWHTCTVTGRDAMAEINKRLLAYRATPHPTTGKTPAELMYGGRRYRTRLPETKQDTQSAAVKEAQETDKKNKMKQKEYKDQRQYVKPHSLKPGDLALLAQKQTKRNPPYDPRPYRITVVRGHQITGKRNEKVVTRDAKKWKILKESKKEQKPSKKEEASSSDEDIYLRGNRELAGPNRAERAGLTQTNHRDEEEEPPAADVNTQHEAATEGDNGNGARVTTTTSAPTTAATPPTDNRRTTRSQGLSLSWNPVMNAKNGPLTSSTP